VRQIRKRLTYANVMSSIAVFLVVGGATAFAALGKNSVGTKQLKKNAVTAAKLKKNAVTAAKIKKNSVTGGKVKNHSLTGADIDFNRLGTVPSATSAISAVGATNAVNATNAANANNATTAANLVGLKNVSGSGPENSMTTLFSTGQFDVVGICSETEEFDPPGFQYEDVSSAIGIINRGENHGWADTFDDDNSDFNVGEGVAFDYLDAGDPGTAVLPNGHWIHVLGGTITEHGTNANFGPGCTFHAVVFYG